MHYYYICSFYVKGYFELENFVEAIRYISDAAEVRRGFGMTPSN